MHWDYLILTASNDRQAAGYESQLAARKLCGTLDDVGQALVVADPQGRRVGSGGSTIYCLMRVLREECHKTGEVLSHWDQVERIFRRLRILILHAGGDSRRVPAYGPCGKIFSPVPGPIAGPVSPMLFDRLYPLFQSLPIKQDGAGQIIVAAGDAMMVFDPSSVHFDWPGIVALGVAATPEAASKHGVFCVEPDGRVRLVLQKPNLADQDRMRAVRDVGQTVLDIGLMNFDATTTVAMLRALDMQLRGNAVALPHDSEELILELGLDLYREISCALGSEATAAHHLESCRKSGSKWPQERLSSLFDGLHNIPMYCDVLRHCSFLHFGTTRQLITSGKELLEFDGMAPGDGLLSVNNRISGNARIEGRDSWIEGCRINEPLTLVGENVVVGVDVSSPLELLRGAVLDVIAGKTPDGRVVSFVRCYHVADTFKDTIANGATLAGQPILRWLKDAGLEANDVWSASIPVAERTLWDAKVFPAVDDILGYRDWLWMFTPSRASAEQKLAYRQAERFSVAEIAMLADMDLFYARREVPI